METKEIYEIAIVKKRLETAEYEKRLVMQRFRPSHMHPIILYHDGLRWVCAHGIWNQQFADLLPGLAGQEPGVVAYGACPEAAMQNFDAMWCGMNESEEPEEEQEEEQE